MGSFGQLHDRANEESARGPARLLTFENLLKGLIWPIGLRGPSGGLLRPPPDGGILIDVGRTRRPQGRWQRSWEDAGRCVLVQGLGLSGRVWLDFVGSLMTFISIRVFLVWG